MYFKNYKRISLQGRSLCSSFVHCFSLIVPTKLLQNLTRPTNTVWPRNDLKGISVLSSFEPDISPLLILWVFKDCQFCQSGQLTLFYPLIN